MAQLGFFLSALVWNFGLGMAWLVVPLYAHSLGLSGAEIGLLFSLPSVVQVAVNFVGGAYVDRVGGRTMMLASMGLVVAGAAAMPFAAGFWSLFAAQLALVFSRAVYWPATWALAAELPGARGVQAGRLNAVTSLGQIAGNSACGFVLALGGFAVTFGVYAAAGLAALALGWLTPRSARRAAAGQGLFAHYGVLLRMPVLIYGTLCAYLAALPFSLTMSFYPLLLRHLGYGEEPSGVLLALRAVGGIAAGLAIARFVQTGPASRWPVAAGAAVAAGVALQPLVEHWAGVGLLLLAIGVGSSLMTVYFQVTMGEVVPPGMRGSAMALAGLGWAVSHFSTPLAMGFLADRFGISTGFYAMGAAALVVVGAVEILRRWAFAATKLGAPA